MNDTIIIAILSSGALSALITGLFSMLQTRKSKATGLEAKVDRIAAEQDLILKAQRRHEMDILRVELKIMIDAFPDDENDILRLAEHYFTAGGNWVMSKVFSDYLSARKIPVPGWYKEGGN